jgi:hypothetical protein
MIEEWKTIEGYSDYQISNLGRVKSTYKYRGSSKRIRKICKYFNGYLYVGLYKENKIKACKIHRLVLSAFKPIEDPELYQCNHIDGNKSNNNIDNLEWCTGSENIKHAFRTGLKYNKGERHSQNKLMEKDVFNIRDLLKEKNFSQRKIAEMFNVSENTISMIKLGQRWSHI